MPLRRPDEAGDYIPLVWELSLYQVIGLVFGGLRIRLRGHQTQPNVTSNCYLVQLA